jgi:phenylacetate-CoA ligase
MISEISELVRLMRNRYLPADELRDLQERKLRAVVRNACERVPYYRTLFDTAGLSPADIRTPEDLNQIPMTTKEGLKAAGLENTLARGTDPASCVHGRTSGSTGLLMESFHSPAEARTRRLLVCGGLRAAGYGPRHRLCVLGTGVIQPVRLHHRLGFFRTSYSPASRSVPEHLDLLRRVQPDLLKIWPSVLRALMHAVGDRLQKVVRPRAVLTSSEICDDRLRKQIREDLGADHFDVYVANEVGEIAWECRAHEGLHVNADHVILECLNDTGEPCQPGELGTAVVTSLYGLTMPFIRYRLGDLCTAIGQACSCGCTLPLIAAPVGRERALMVLPSGARQAPSGVAFRLHGIDSIHQYRLIQEHRDEFRLLLVPVTQFQPETLASIRAEVLDAIGEPVRLDIQVVASIPEERGKFRWFISKLEGDDGRDGPAR